MQIDSCDSNSENELHCFTDSDDSISDVPNEKKHKSYANSESCGTRDANTSRNSPTGSEDVPMLNNDDNDNDNDDNDNDDDDDDIDDIQCSSESDAEPDSASDDEECSDSSDDQIEDIYNENLVTDNEDDNNYGEVGEADHFHNNQVCLYFR